MKPKISLICLNYNGLRHLGLKFEANLQAIVKTEYDNFEVILLDNNSTDNSLETMKGFENPNVRVIALDRNYGYAEGNNIGARLASSLSKYVIFLNFDITVSGTWLKTLVENVEKDDRIAAAQPIILEEGSSFIDTAGGLIDHLGFLYPRKTQGNNSTIDVFLAFGACLLVDRAKFLAIGGFDPKFFIQYEEVDLSWRLRLDGYRVVCVGSAYVVHGHGPSVSSTATEFRFFHQSKNHLRSLIKNSEATIVVPSCVLFLASVLFVSLLRQKSIGKNIVDSVFRALSWNIVNLGETLQLRKKVNRTRKVTGNQLRNDGFIVPFAPLQKLSNKF